jgi:dienelactone hydrolase
MHSLIVLRDHWIGRKTTLESLVKGNTLMIPGQLSARNGIESEVSVDAGNAMLAGTLALPKKLRGVVLFAHGSGSGRHSPRNQYVAGVLQSQGFGTLLFDLLTPEEEAVDQFTGQLRFDIHLLADRLVAATRWIMSRPDMKELQIGYFGASTGAAAALVAAAELPGAVAAVVSRGGRPDLAAESLGLVRAPTLLIVGGDDKPVIAMNREALAELRYPDKEVMIVPGATHLFEEPGTLEEVARLAAEWFTHYLGKEGHTESSRNVAS